MSEYNAGIPGAKPEKVPADVRINGPHEVFKDRSFLCEGECGKELIAGEDKFYFFGTGPLKSRSKRMCVDCTKEQIV